MWHWFRGFGVNGVDNTSGEREDVWIGDPFDRNNTWVPFVVQVIHKTHLRIVFRQNLIIIRNSHSGTWIDSLEEELEAEDSDAVKT